MGYPIALRGFFGWLRPMAGRNGYPAWVEATWLHFQVQSRLSVFRSLGLVIAVHMKANIFVRPPQAKS
jgi:hypothetical protein